MATIILKDGQGTLTGVTITANAAGSTATRYVLGPPGNRQKYGGLPLQGRYMLQTGTTFRFVDDEPLATSSTTPTGFTADNL